VTDQTLAELDRLGTEQPNPRTSDLDQLDTLAILQKLNDEDAMVAGLVRAALPELARAVDLAVERWERGGRIILFGAGTSGRLALLDAAELGPTFSVPANRYVARIAGGAKAFERATEGAEDDVEAGQQAAADLGPGDAAFGVAASGRTPWVVGALTAARRQGSATIALSCVASPALADCADVSIEIPTGPEAIAGSTRLKAGTAQKLVLNSFSTTLMIRLGKVHGNLMVDVQLTNRKLERRAVRLVEQIAGVDRDLAEQTLRAAGDLKTAIVTLRRGLSIDAARARLAAVGGRLRDALEGD
jgi:N-acetylmuramic acid 6-phosphate etherase